MLPSIVFCPKILDLVPCAVQQDLPAYPKYLLKYDLVILQHLGLWLYHSPSSDS